jgi:hypothetical protein
MTGPADTFRLLTVGDLARLPAPAFLLENFLPVGAFSVLYGPAGGFKTFLALSWALCVATGRSWYGKQARRGPVLYITPEGVGGLLARVRAWQEDCGERADPSVVFLPEALNLLDPATVAKGRRTVLAMPEPPVLIVIDTLARSMAGGDENSAKDVGLFIAHVDALGRDVGAARLVVHHTGKDGLAERGSSALRAAADAMHSLKPDGAGIKLECSKAKDAEPYTPWRLHPVAAGGSVVLRPGTAVGLLSPAEQQILAAVSEAFGTRPVSGTQLRDAADVSKSSFYRALRGLLDRGFLLEIRSGSGARYCLTREGHAHLSPTPSQPVPTQDVPQSHGPSLLEAGTGTVTRTPHRPLNAITGDDV